jgi:dTDP-4-amino-4,6-dideoxygalactose transaminase
MKVPLLDLKRQYASIKQEIDNAVHRVLENTQFILGEDVRNFEAEVAEYCGSKHAVGVASGTDALLLALRACGVGPEDEVLIPDFTYIATSNVVSRLGAVPVFVDIDGDTYNVDPNLIEKKISKKTKAIIPVHLFGQCADMDSILEISRGHNLKVIEDAAQAIGAEYKGKKAGTMGDLGAFSFFPSKNLGAAGDGGMVITDDENLAEAIRKLRVHGATRKYFHSVVGYNSRLDTLQAAILSVKLKHLDEWSDKRKEKASFYDSALKDLGIQTPKVESFNRHIYHQYTIAVEKRDQLKDHLLKNQIGCSVYYPLPLHLQECYQSLGHKEGDFPISEKRSKQAISLPVFPEITQEEQEFVVKTIEEFYSV